MTHHYMREQLKVKIVLEEECGRLMDNIYIFHVGNVTKTQALPFYTDMRIDPGYPRFISFKTGVFFCWQKSCNTVHNSAAMQHFQIRK